MLPTKLLPVLEQTNDAPVKLIDQYLTILGKLNRG